MFDIHSLKYDEGKFYVIYVKIQVSYDYLKEASDNKVPMRLFVANFVEILLK